MPVTAERSGQENKGKSKGGKGKVGKGKVRGKGKGKLNSVENSNWQEGWLEAGASNRQQGEEHVDGCWKDEPTGSSSSSGCG